jgi:Ca-activated chloride channel family protein
LLAPIALLCASGAIAQGQQAAPSQATLSPAIIVLDGSRSMWNKLGGQSKVAIVRSNLGETFKTYEDRIAFGLVAAGHRQGKTCAEAELIAKPGELTSKTPGKLLFGAGFKPKLGRPIAAALVEAAKQTPPTGLDVVLITDGLDSCKANVCATVKSLKQAAPGLRIHVIGFDPKAKQTIKPLACVAQSTGGQFLTAASANELKQDLTSVLESVAKPAPQPAPAAQSEGGTAKSSGRSATANRCARNRNCAAGSSEPAGKSAGPDRAHGDRTGQERAAEERCPGCPAARSARASRRSTRAA